ncbi:MAG TPA: phosphate-starvation-inducible PsiE family protein [Solirubrobacteraceae bacterium]
MVAVVLLVVAAIVLWRAVHDLATSDQPLVTATTTAVNAVLFTIIILEVMRTVLAHLEDAGLQLQPFLIIGTISAVRSILAVGARLSLQGTQHEPARSVIDTALRELGVNAAVVLGLAVALTLVRRIAGMGDDPMLASAPRANDERGRDGGSSG